MVLSKHRDVPARLALALRGGFDRRVIEQHAGLLPGEAQKVVDRLRDGCAL